MTNRHRVLMAISCLARRSAQHGHAKTSGTDTSAAPKHTRFAAATSAEVWHECKEHPEGSNQEPTTVFVGTAPNREPTEMWHDCKQQSWSASQISDHHRYPQLTNSEIRKKKRQAVARHTVEAAMQVAAAAVQP